MSGELYSKLKMLVLMNQYKFNYITQQTAQNPSIGIIVKTVDCSERIQ